MSQAVVWCDPPLQLSLAPDEVHVWRTLLDGLSSEESGAYRRTLSSDEVKRAESFHFARDRERFVVARGTLRILLGRYLDQHPRDLRFAYNRWGKPFLNE